MHEERFQYELDIQLTLKFMHETNDTYSFYGIFIKKRRPTQILACSKKVQNKGLEKVCIFRVTYQKIQKMRLG